MITGPRLAVWAVKRPGSGDSASADYVGSDSVKEFVALIRQRSDSDAVVVLIKHPSRVTSAPLSCWSTKWGRRRYSGYIAFSAVLRGLPNDFGIMHLSACSDLLRGVTKGLCF